MHCAKCSLENCSTHLTSTSKQSSTTRSAAYVPMGLPGNREGGLGPRPNAAKAEFLDESPFVGLFQKSRPQKVAHLIGGPDHFFDQIFQTGTLIIAGGTCPPLRALRRFLFHGKSPLEGLHIPI